MATEFTPELDQSVLDALKRKIQAQEAEQISQAQGMAQSRGLTGSTFEATRIGLANKASIDAQTDAMVNMALQRATQQREERLLQEQRTYESGESEKSRTFQDKQARLSETYNSLENEKQRAYAMGETEKARQFEAQQAGINRQFQQSLADQESRSSMINAGISGGAGLLGNVIGRGGGVGGLFGGGTTAAGGIGSAGVGGGGMGLAGMGGLLGTGIGLVGGGYAGQSLAKLTGKNTREAKAGSAIGAGVGTLFGGPLGGIVGGAAGGLVTKGVQGISKKLFCFDPSTLIELQSGVKTFIRAVVLGDTLNDGGVIESIRISRTGNGTRYSYKGVIVTGSHAVKENGKWVRVQDSKEAMPVPGEGVVVSLVTTTHRLFINGVEFADEHETDDYEELSIDESLVRLNEAA